MTTQAASSEYLQIILNIIFLSIDKSYKLHMAVSLDIYEGAIFYY